jgi:uncharacterized protein YdeI (YjbR/CyaY-like superfamily)
VSESYERVQVDSRAGWREWLAANAATAPGIWAVTWKKAAAGPSVAYEELVEEALCFGWIDSVRRTVDDGRSRLLFTPRRPGSGWSRPNKERIERLVAAGLMTPAGAALIEAAKADGSWASYDEIDAMVEPDDLRAALDASPGARANWDAFPPSARRAILGWISQARRSETRARRVTETVTRAARGERANEWTRKS